MSVIESNWKRATDLGTIIWCEQSNGGQMNSWEKLSIVYGSAHSGLSSFLMDVKSQFCPPTKLHPSTLILPDTEASKVSEDYLTKNVYEGDALLHHCKRTYLFGSMLAHDFGLANEVDHELLYVASLWHDAGLGRCYRDAMSTADFAYTGGKAMERFALETLKWSAPRSERAADIISLHLNTRVVANRPEGVEAFLLHAGAWMDVAGLRVSRVHIDSVRRVLELFPRDGFAAVFAENFAREVLPDSRVAFDKQLGALAYLSSRNKLDQIQVKEHKH